MRKNAASDAGRPLTKFEQLRLGQEVIRSEATALESLADRLPPQFSDAVQLLYGCSGSIIVTGIGKAGIIGQKVSATLASTGAPSHFLHPAEAVHGDLGRIQPRDVVLALSFSGETDELVRLLPIWRERDVPVVAITRAASTSLARAAQVVLEVGPLEEACNLGLAPSTSTTVMLALGDALALVLSRMRGFRAEDFARFHPGGNLGRSLGRVDDVLRPLDVCRLARETDTVREVLVKTSKPGRRTGAVMLTTADGRLTGIFTDSDLARLLEARREAALDEPIRYRMTHQPRTVAARSRLAEAVAVMAEAKISELPVVDPAGRPVGMIDVTDVVGLFPAETDPSALPWPAGRSA